MDGTRPLLGKKILVTRAKEQAASFVNKIETLGGTPIVVPLLAFRPPANKERLNLALQNLSTYDWLIFTSINGVRFFFEQLNDEYRTQLKKLKLAVVGTKTEQQLNKYGFTAEFVPNEFVAESFAESLLKWVKQGEKVLFPRGNLARTVIPKALRNEGIDVFEFDVYETVAAKESYVKLRTLILEQSVDYITFTSSSTVEYFAEAIAGLENDLQSVQLVGIGPITEQTALKHNLKLDIVAKVYTTEGLLDAIVTSLKEMKK